MRYAELPEAVRADLESNFEVLIKYSDAADVPRNTVLATMIVGNESPIEPEKMAGFDYRGAATDAFRQWFEFDTKDMSDEDAARFAANVLLSLPAEEDAAADSVPSEPNP